MGNDPANHTTDDEEPGEPDGPGELTADGMEHTNQNAGENDQSFSVEPENAPTYECPACGAEMEDSDDGGYVCPNECGRNDAESDPERLDVPDEPSDHGPER